MRVPYFNLDILFRCFILSKLFFCISLLTKFENLMPLKMKTVRKNLTHSFVCFYVEVIYVKKLEVLVFASFFLIDQRRRDCSRRKSIFVWKTIVRNIMYAQYYIALKNLGLHYIKSQPVKETSSLKISKSLPLLYLYLENGR